MKRGRKAYRGLHTTSGFTRVILNDKSEEKFNVRPTESPLEKVTPGKRTRKDKHLVRSPVAEALDEACTVKDNTQRQRDRREAIRRDPVKNEEYKKRTNEQARMRYAKKLENLTEEEMIAVKKKCSEKRQKNRRAKAAREGQENRHVTLNRLPRIKKTGCNAATQTCLSEHTGETPYVSAHNGEKPYDSASSDINLINLSDETYPSPTEIIRNVGRNIENSLKVHFADGDSYDIVQGSVDDSLDLNECNDPREPGEMVLCGSPPPLFEKNDSCFMFKDI